MKFRLSRRKVFLLAGALFLVASAVYWVLFADKIFPVIEGKIYRSSRLTEKSLENTIKSKGIMSILNLWDKKDAAWYLKESAMAQRYGVTLYTVGLSPRELPDYPKLLEIMRILREAEKPILIHCLHGADRSGMVSALALTLELDPPLSEVKKQVSWRYGVFPFYRSIGPYFFSKYEDWLGKSRESHSRSTLLHWIESDYVDDKANLSFWVERVNGLECRRRTVISGDPRSIVIEGWTYDSRIKAPVDGLYVTLDNKIASKITFRHNMPGVARYFNLGAQYYENFVVGWTVAFARDGVTGGCHDVFIRRVKSESETIDVPTNCGFCL